MRKGVFLILILLFPSIVYLLFSLGEHRVEKIGSFGKYTVGQDGDTNYVPIPPLELYTSTDSMFVISDLRGNPVLIDLFEIPCDEACMKKGVTLVNYLHELPERDQWRVLSIGLKAGIAPDELRRLEQLHLPEMKNWSFVTAMDQTALDAFIHYLFIETGRLSSASDLPSSEFVLIDQQGVIRGFFDSRTHADSRKMEDAIKLLLKEPYLTWKDKKN